MHWPLSMVTTMRSGWEKSSPYLFTNVRGGGQHGHSDYNGVIVYAYGTTLLNDAGIFTYEENKWRDWGTSTKAHNSVTINDMTQYRGGTQVGSAATGTIYDWATNESFDFLDQSTPQNNHGGGYDHRRSITFIKPNMWIVSDKITTVNGSLNNYKQTWHMKPEAKLAIDTENNTIYSNYSSGANIIVASADGEDATVNTENGWYDRSYQQLQEAPFGYFEKNVYGTATFDTVLIPSNNDPSAKATAKKLDTIENATAVEIDYTLDGIRNKGYYYMSYDAEAGTFGKYSTDAQVAYVNETESGQVEYFMLHNGTYIKNNVSGEYLVKSDSLLNEFSVDMTSAEIVVTSSESTDVYIASQEPTHVFDTKGVTDDLTSVVVKTSPAKTFSGVVLNGKSVTYDINNFVLSNIGNGTQTGTSEEIGKVPSAGIDSESKNPSGDGAGGGGTGGGAGGTGTENKDDDKKEDSETDIAKSFPDTKGHWAENYINSLKAKNIVNGDTEGKFNPDKNITRAEFVAIITRSLNIESVDYKETFNDVSASDWYVSTVQTALDYGLISQDEKFRPNDNITRQEMAKIISVAAEKSGKFNDAEIKFSTFNDAEDVASWAQEYVDYVFSIGLMQGMDGNNFKPLNNATRAETATVTYRLLELLQETNGEKK